MNKYKKASQKIHKEAEKFLNSHAIESLLKEFGNIEYFGSYKLNLMNRNDIDIVLEVKTIDITIVTALIERLNKKGFNRHWVFDNTDGGCKSDPKHIVYESVFGFFNDNVDVKDRWELGIVITTAEIKEEVTKLTKEVSLYPDNLKNIILKLKFELAEKYGEHKYTGTQVYTAVSEGIRSTSGFLKYINKS